MRQLVIALALLTYFSTIGKGQNMMKLNEYTICSNQLDSIITMVLNDVGDYDCIDISVKDKENGNSVVYVSAYMHDFLRYSSKILGYTIKANKTIFFLSSTKDMITKKTGGKKRIIRCIPPTKNNGLINVIGTDGVKEWVFSIDKESVTLLRKVLEW